MKSLALIFTLPLLLAGCGSSDSNSNNRPKGFELSSFYESNQLTSQDSLQGTWIASKEITRTRSNQINTEVPEVVNSSALEVFVIRPTETGYERSNCNGEFENIYASGTSFISQSDNASIVNNSNMNGSKTASQTINLSSFSSYFEVTTTQTEFIKVSDAYQTFGSITQNWSDRDSVITRDVFCSRVENLPESKRNITLSGNKEFFFYMSDVIDPARFNAYIFDIDHTSNIKNLLTFGEQHYSVYEETENTFKFEYFANSMSGVGILGNAVINIPQ